MSIKSMGRGLLTSQGDGTPNNEQFEFVMSTGLTPNPTYAAKSAQWKDSVPYLLEHKNGNKSVLFIEKAAWSSAEDFKARYKFIQSGAEKNAILNCHRI